MKNTSKFLQFNGKNIVMVSADGIWYVAIKPICEALGVDYIRQFKKIKEDSILDQLLSEQTMVAADEKLRKMTCLPEKAIYGWLFSINSDAPGLVEYKWECYNVLFDHFHGSIAGRKTLISEKVKNKMELDKAKQSENPEVQALLELMKKEKQIANQMRGLDTDAMQEQYSLFTEAEQQ